MRGGRRPSRALVARWEEMCGLPAGELLVAYEQLPSRRAQRTARNPGGRASPAPTARDVDTDAQQSASMAERATVDEVVPQPIVRSSPGEKSARLLRALTGVDEALLARVPSERAIYTRLGAAIVACGAIAGIYLGYAFAAALGLGWPIVVVSAVVWGVFIITLDSWFVASLHGTRWRSAPWLLVPRIALAVIVGILVAEPFVLRVFEPAIEARVIDQRQQRVVVLEARLRLCNPDSGNPPTVVTLNGCSDDRIDVEGIRTPAAFATELADLRRLRGTLRDSVRSTAKRQAQLDDVARRQCDPKRGSAPSCQRSRASATAYRRSSEAAARSRRLDAVETRIAQVVEDQQVGASQYRNAVRKAISAKVTAARTASHAEIGLLERLAALHSLTEGNWYLATAEWLLRLTFIVIDCLPLLVRLLTRATTYDRLVDLRDASAERSLVADLRAASQGEGAPEENDGRAAHDRQRAPDARAVESTDALPGSKLPR